MGRILSIYDTHLLREQLGLTLAVSEDLLRDFGKALLCVAGADGAVSPQERTFMLGQARALGASPALVEEFRAFDPRKAHLADHLTPQVQPMAKHMLYTALRVARADGIAPGERAEAERMAKALRVDPGFVPALEGFLQLEDAVLAARVRLLGTTGTGPKALAAAAVVEQEWLLRAHYGLTFPLGPETRRKVARAVLWVAGADKVLSEAERTYALGLARAMGATEDEVGDLLRFDPGKARMGQVLDAATRPLARIVLYDALRVARADKLSPPERDAAARMAKRLELDPALLPALEGLLDIEDAANALRMRLLSPAE